MSLLTRKENSYSMTWKNGGMVETSQLKLSLNMFGQVNQKVKKAIKTTTSLKISSIVVK